MTHGYLEVKNWEHFQHYKDRNPPWIKLHAAVLDDYEWAGLPDASKAHLMGIWILASKLGNKVPADPVWIAERMGAKSPVDLETLITAGFLTCLRRASDVPQAEPLVALPEGEGEAQDQARESTTTSANAAPTHTHRSCLGLVVEKLYFGARPPEAAMRTEASIARALGERYGYDLLARAIEGLARRRELGEFPHIGPRQTVSLKWLNSAKFDINQLAASEDAYYRSDPSPRTGRGGATGLSDLLANFGKPA